MKHNNKGFTLIELLGVIVLLAVITTIAVPSIMGISRNIKKGMLDTKIDLILEEAKLYAQDNISTIAGSTTKYNGYTCTTTTIGELLEEGYLSSDKQDEEAGFVVNPVDKSSLNDEVIILYIKNKRAVAIMADTNLDGTKESSCS